MTYLYILLAVLTFLWAITMTAWIVSEFLIQRFEYEQDELARQENL